MNMKKKPEFASVNEKDLEKAMKKMIKISGAGGINDGGVMAKKIDDERVVITDGRVLFCVPFMALTMERQAILEKYAPGVSFLSKEVKEHTFPNYEQIINTAEQVEVEEKKLYGQRVILRGIDDYRKDIDKYLYTYKANADSVPIDYAVNVKYIEIIELLGAHVLSQAEDKQGSNHPLYASTDTGDVFGIVMPMKLED